MSDLFDLPSVVFDRRPVLVGMNNPLNSDPKYALFPAPTSATGYRIFQMLQETGVLTLRKEYIDAFDRRNVLDSVVWDKRAARIAGPRLWRELGGRTVLLLGREVLAAIGLQQVMPLEWRGPDEFRTGAQPERWCYIPHPSGLNHWYNNPVQRASVGLRLEQVLEESRA